MFSSTIDIQQNAPEYIPSPNPGLTTCDISTTLCQAGDFDPFLLCTALWSTLQLTWTFVLAISHLWQVSRQMTTFEVSNLGRYGFMGGRGGQSLRDQSGAMLKQASAVGAGIGMSGAGEEAAGPADAEAGPEGNALLPPPGGHVHGPQCRHGNHARGHSHGVMHICGALWKTLTGPLMTILGLDRFTKGKALGGMKKAGRDQNPFDMGIVKVNSTDPYPIQNYRTNRHSELHRFLVTR